MAAATAIFFGRPYAKPFLADFNLEPRMTRRYGMISVQAALSSGLHKDESRRENVLLAATTTILFGSPYARPLAANRILIRV